VRPVPAFELLLASGAALGGVVLLESPEKQEQVNILPHVEFHLR